MADDKKLNVAGCLGILAVLVGILAVAYGGYRLERWWNWKWSYGPRVEKRIEKLEKRIEKLESLHLREAEE